MKVSGRSGSFGFVCGWLLAAGKISCSGWGLASPAVLGAGAGGQVVLDERHIILQQLT